MRFNHCLPFLRWLLTATGILVCLWLLFLGALRLVATLPEGPIRQQLEAADKAGAFQKMYPRLGFYRLELFTECDAAGIALRMQPSMDSILRMEHYGACDSLPGALRNPDTAAVGYPRYWHGSQLLLRPLLTLLPWWGVPCVLALLTGSVFAFFVASLKRRFGNARSLLILAAFFPAATLNLFVLGTHAAVFLVILLMSCLLLRGHLSQTPLFFLIIGALDAFFSFLNQPSLSLGLPVLLLVLMRHQEGTKAPAIIREFFLCGLAWSFALIATWLCKWGLAAILTPDASLFGNKLETLSSYSTRHENAFFNATLQQFIVMTKKLYLPVLAWTVWRLYRGRRLPDPGLWLVCLPAAVPFVWYALLPNMVNRHAWFMHISLWPFLAALLLMLFGKPREPELPWSDMLHNAFAALTRFMRRLRTKVSQPPQQTL